MEVGSIVRWRGGGFFGEVVPAQAIVVTFLT